MTQTLAAFQDAFADALFERPAPALQALIAQPGFAVYRNGVLKACIDALCDNFPSVERLVGRDWLRATAALYAREIPPQDARLAFYGERFGDFLDGFAPARELPYLGDVARLDRLWLESFLAPQEAPLTLASLHGMDAEVLAGHGLRPRASVRWRWFAVQPIYSIWHHNREARAMPQSLPWQGEGVLLVGDLDGVRWQALGQGACAFLDACAAGHDLAQASHRALAVQADLDFTELLGRLLAAAVFRPLNPT